MMLWRGRGSRSPILGGRVEKMGHISENYHLSGCDVIRGVGRTSLIPILGLVPNREKNTYGTYQFQALRGSKAPSFVRNNTCNFKYDSHLRAMYGDVLIKKLFITL